MYRYLWKYYIIKPRISIAFRINFFTVIAFIILCFTEVDSVFTCKGSCSKVQLYSVFVWTLCCSPSGLFSYFLVVVWRFPVPFLGFRLAASPLVPNLRDSLPAHVCCTTLFLWVVLDCIHKHSNFDKGKTVMARRVNQPLQSRLWLCICRHLSAHAQSVATGLLNYCLHKRQSYLCLSSLPESSFNFEL